MIAMREDLHAAVDDMKSRTPRSVRKQAVMLRHGVRAATAMWRTLPNLLVIGAQRCGTSSLYKYLSRHPAAFGGLRKEVRYFSLYHDLGTAWYKAHFPLRWTVDAARRQTGANPIIFEATPDYLFHHDAPQWVKSELGHPKLIVLLRDPVERAYSHYGHRCRLGLETRSFGEALDLEQKLVGNDVEFGAKNRPFSYFGRGLYAQHLKVWLDTFGTQSIHIVKSEDFFARTGESFADILKFLELPEWSPREFRNYSYAGGVRSVSGALTPEIRAQLSERYREPNRELYELTGRDFGW